MLVITSGNATRQYGEGGFPSKTNCSKAVTSSADTMTNPYINIEGKRIRAKRYRVQQSFSHMYVATEQFKVHKMCYFISLFFFSTHFDNLEQLEYKSLCGWITNKA